LTRITLDKVGKKYAGQWVFRAISDNFSASEKIAVTGFNGSGKSTLLQLLSAFQTPTEGSITFESGGSRISPDQWYKYISCGAPYLDLPEDLTLRENVSFFSSFKPIQQSLSPEQFADIAELSHALDKPLKHFSSGMKQRVRLSLAILADVPALLLDEPLSNLDRKGILWYSDMIHRYAESKLVIVCSNNQEEEISFCSRALDINLFK
jgi:ABC-type multidrug transport system ATPase subunit